MINDEEQAAACFFCAHFGDMRYFCSWMYEMMQQAGEGTLWVKGR